MGVFMEGCIECEFQAYMHARGVGVDWVCNDFAAAVSLQSALRDIHAVFVCSFRGVSQSTHIETCTFPSRRR